MHVLTSTFIAKLEPNTDNKRNGKLQRRFLKARDLEYLEMRALSGKQLELPSCFNVSSCGRFVRHSWERNRTMDTSHGPLLSAPHPHINILSDSLRMMES